MLQIKKELKRWILPASIILCLAIMPLMASPASAPNYPGPFFSVGVLAPNTNPVRNQWATLMVEQLPKIGIEVEVFDHTGWAQIGPRTWNHPGPYPIPTYAEGGFDIFFVGNGWGLDFDPSGVFTTDGITPLGDNYYQYSSQEMDWAIANYTQSFIYADRIEYAEKIQEILYEDNPSLCIIYQTSLYAHDPDLEGWDPLLFTSNYQPMENWTLGDQTAIHVAIPADFVDFHPILYESVYDAYWLRQIYNGLADRNVLFDRSPQPRIAESISTTDGLVYNVELKDDLYWADGTPITVEDIIYNYRLLVTPTLGHSTYSFYCNYLNNDSVVKINEKEFTVTFLQPYVFQMNNFMIDLLPSHIWNTTAPADHGIQAVDWANSDPEKLFGFGPYRLANYDSTNGIIHLTKNEYFDEYYGSEPYLDDIYFEYYDNKEGALSALVGGFIDLIEANFFVQLSDLEGISGIEHTIVDEPGNQCMDFNCLHPYFGTGELCPIADLESAKHIRKAVSHLIPRDIIIEEILEGLGYPGVTYWPRVSIGYDTTLIPYDYSVEEALEHMKAAGFDITITEDSGIGLYIVIGTLALIGACQIFILKKKK